MHPQQDADRAQRHQNSLREVELRLAQERLRRQELAQAVCTDRDSARLWWLEQHLDDLTALNWTSFKDTILPLVGTSVAERTQAERLAHTLLYVWERLHDVPGRQARFVATARTLFEQMRWADGFLVLTVLPMLPVGLGLGMIGAALTDMTLRRVDHDHAGSASGLFNTATQLGIALGTALTAVVFFAHAPAASHGTTVTAAFTGTLWYVIAALLAMWALMLWLPKRHAMH